MKESVSGSLARRFAYMRRAGGGADPVGSEISCDVVYSRDGRQPSLVVVEPASQRQEPRSIWCPHQRKAGVSGLSCEARSSPAVDAARRRGGALTGAAEQHREAQGVGGQGSVRRLDFSGSAGSGTVASPRDELQAPQTARHMVQQLSTVRTEQEAKMENLKGRMGSLMTLLEARSASPVPELVQNSDGIVDRSALGRSAVASPASTPSPSALASPASNPRSARGVPGTQSPRAADTRKAAGGCVRSIHATRAMTPLPADPAPGRPDSSALPAVARCARGHDHKTPSAQAMPEQVLSREISMSPPRADLAMYGSKMHGATRQKSDATPPKRGMALDDDAISVGTTASHYSSPGSEPREQTPPTRMESADVAVGTTSFTRLRALGDKVWTVSQDRCCKVKYAPGMMTTQGPGRPLPPRSKLSSPRIEAEQGSYLVDVFQISDAGITQDDQSYEEDDAEYLFTEVIC